MPDQPHIGPTRADLAERLKQEAMQIRASRDGTFSDGMAEGLERAASIARAASPPHTGPTRVEPAQMIAELLTIIAATPPGTPDGDDRRSRLRAAADLLATHLPLAALEPASPTPTEQENDR